MLNGNQKKKVAVFQTESTFKASILGLLAKECSLFRAKWDFVYVLKRHRGRLLQKRTYLDRIFATIDVWSTFWFSDGSTLCLRHWLQQLWKIVDVQKVVNDGGGKIIGTIYSNIRRSIISFPASLIRQLPH